MAVAFILKGYPRLSETFIAQEILGLEKRGLDIHLYSMRHPTDKSTHPIHAEIKAPVNYLPEYLYQEPMRVLKAWIKMRKKPGYKQAFSAFIKDLKRDFTPNRIRRFGQGIVLAAELPDHITRIHFHFLHTPAAVARYAATIREMPWSGSAHAKDIWTSPEWDLSEKLEEMDWLVTCTAYGAKYLKKIAPSDEKVTLAYHGLDLNRFPNFDRSLNDHDGSSPEKAVKIISVGRAVAKKGYDDLLVALSNLPKDLHWEFTHVGGGKLINDLKKQAQELGIDHKIKWKGAKPQSEVLGDLQKSDLFILASRVTEDGDRDGLPNVLMEAQSQSLAVISTRISAIPEFIEEGDNGLLVEQQDPKALTESIITLIQDPAKRHSMGRNGNDKLRAAFDADHLLDELAEKFQSDIEMKG